MDPIDISPVFFGVTDNDDVSGAGNSGLAFTGGELYSIDQDNHNDANILDDEACLHRYDANGAEQDEIALTILLRDQNGNPDQGGLPRDPDTLQIVPLADFEGLTYISGVRGGGGEFWFAIAHESTGYIYIFDMNDALLGGPYDVVNNGTLIETGLESGLNCGLEGIAYDPVQDCFYVAKEGTEAGELPRGIYKVPNDPTYVPPGGGPPLLADPGTADIAGLAVSGDYLYVVSQAGALVIRYGIQADGSLIRDLATDPAMNQDLDTGNSQFEGIAVDTANDRIYVIGERDDTADNNEFRRYELTDALAVYDYDMDGNLDGDDIDILTVGIAAQNPAFDANMDLVVDNDDRTYYIEEFLYTYLGDVTLDRFVNAADLNVIGQNWQDQGPHLGWHDGDVVDNDWVNANDLTQIGLFWQMKKL